MSNKALLKNIVSSLFLRIVSMIYGLIIPILIIKYYGSNTNGLVSSITQFLSYIVLLEFGIGPVVKNALFKPLVEKNKKNIEDVLATAKHFFRNIAYIFLVYIFLLCIIYPFVVSDEYSWIFTVTLILAIAINRFSEYFLGMVYKIFLQSDGKNYVIDYIYILTYVLDIIVIYILIKSNLSIQMVKLAGSLIYLIRPLFMKFYFDKKYNMTIKAKSEYKLEKKWDALFHHIATTVQDNTSVIVLTLFSSLTSVSVYSIYALVVSSIRAIINSFVNGLDAFFGKMMVTANKKKIQEKFCIYNFLYYTVTTILLSCTLFLIIPFIKVYTANVHDANYIYPLFGYILVFAEFSYIIRLPYATIAFAKGHFKETRDFSLVEPIVNVILSVILVNKFGLVGVAIASLIALLIRSVGFIVYATKKILDLNIFKTVSIIFLSFIELIITLIFTINIDLSWISTYYQWLIVAVVAFVFICIAIITINAVVYRFESKKVINFIKRRVMKLKRSEN